MLRAARIFFGGELLPTGVGARTVEGYRAIEAGGAREGAIFSSVFMERCECVRFMGVKGTPLLGFDMTVGGFQFF